MTKAIHLFRVPHLILLLAIVGILLLALHTASNPKPVARGTTSVAHATPTPDFHTTLKSSDGKLLITFTLTPNRFGTNMFVVDVSDTHLSKPVTNEQVQIFTTMLDMNMATGVVFLQEQGNGRYSAPGSLSMDGNWDIHIQLVDDSAIHVAKLKLYTPA